MKKKQCGAVKTSDKGIKEPPQHFSTNFPLSNKGIIIETKIGNPFLQLTFPPLIMLFSI